MNPFWSIFTYCCYLYLLLLRCSLRRVAERAPVARWPEKWELAERWFCQRKSGGEPGQFSLIFVSSV